MSYDDSDKRAADEIERAVRLGHKVDERCLRFAVKYFSSKCRMVERCTDISSRVIEACSREFCVSESNIRSTSRFADAWDARHCAVALMRAAGMTLNEISEALGKKRQNICYAIRAVRNRLDTEPSFVTVFKRIAEDAGVKIPRDWC